MKRLRNGTRSYERLLQRPPIRSSRARRAGNFADGVGGHCGNGAGVDQERQRSACAQQGLHDVMQRRFPIPRMLERTHDIARPALELVAAEVLGYQCGDCDHIAGA